MDLLWPSQTPTIHLKIQKAEEIKKEEEKHSCLLIIWCSHMFLILFSRDRQWSAKSNLSLASPITLMSLNGQEMGTRMEFLISTATGTCHTNLSYLPATSTIRARLQVHHPRFVLHPVPKLVGLLWGWRTESLWTASHTLIQTAQVQQPWWWWLSLGKLARLGFAWKPWSYWKIKMFNCVDT